MKTCHSPSRATVYIVEPDGLIRDSLQDLLRSNGYWTPSAPSAEIFLGQLVNITVPCCLITEVRLPGMSGLELQSRLSSVQPWIPVIFLTNCSEIGLVVKAMKGQAIDYILKPFASCHMLQSIDDAMRMNRTRNKGDFLSQQVRERLVLLTPREREIADLLGQGLSTKEIALNLKISGKTVFVHRAHILAKMEVESIVQLVKLLSGFDPMRANAAKPPTCKLARKSRQ